MVRAEDNFSTPTLTKPKLQGTSTHSRQAPPYAVCRLPYAACRLQSRRTPAQTSPSQAAAESCISSS
ncbi:MAG: hypothetical protein ACKOEZ_03595 [Spartobacteria bacterium]